MARSASCVPPVATSARRLPRHQLSQPARKWFRHMVQGLDFWISKEDIGKGTVSTGEAGGSDKKKTNEEGDEGGSPPTS
jgi:hypothetical protein